MDFRLFVLAALCACIYSSPVETESKRDLHGKRIYLRAWGEKEALAYAESGDESIYTHDQAVHTRDRPPTPPPLPAKSGDEAVHARDSRPPTPPPLPAMTPDLMPVTMHSEDGHIHGLLLQKNTRIEHPVTVSYGDTEEHAPLLAEGEAMYHGTMSEAIFGVRNINGVTQFDGSFHLDGERYEVHPLKEDDGVRARGFENHHPHMITRAPVHTYGEPLNFEGAEDIMNAPETEKRGSKKYDVEFAIVVDYSEFLRWKTSEGSESKAIAALKYKFSYTYNGMDKIYKTVNHKGMKINVWLKKLDIQTDNSKTVIKKVYKNIDPASARLTKIDASAILGEEAGWGKTNGFKVPEDYDHVMYWVGHQIENNGNDATIGLAYVGGVCDSSAGFSLIEDTGFESFRTAAHELGHNLGSHHDSSSGDCAASKHHIMAATEGMPDAAHNADGWKFSTCSLDQFDSTLAPKTCLGNGGSNSFGSVSVSQLPGEKYNADWQCAWTNMNLVGTKHCKGGTVDEDECYKGMWCKKTGGCTLSSSLRPTDGTPCKGGKCMGGKCA